MGKLEKKLKEEFGSQPEEFYQMLTFDELKAGDKFIAIPLPGDNNKQGGFRVIYSVFEKINPSEDKKEKYDSRKVSTGQLIRYPKDIPVIKIK